MAVVNELSFKSRTGLRKIVLEPEWANCHCMTILKGVNGSQKSTILRDVVNSLILQDSDVDLKYWNNEGKLINSSEKSGFKPVDVFAISGSSSDRFPSKRFGGNNTKWNTPNYHYLGQKAGGALSRKVAMQNLLPSLIRRTREGIVPVAELKEMFQLLKLNPYIDFQIEKVPVKKSDLLIEKLDSYQIERNQEASDLISRNLQKSDKSEGGYSETNYDELKNWLIQNQNYSEISINKNKSRRNILQVSMSNDKFDSNAEISISSIALGLSVGLLRVTEVRVKGVNEEFFQFEELSSGEFQLMQCLLGVWASLIPGSILLIDEPEASLHPLWQVKFMELTHSMRKSFESSSQTIIATHAPLIVSNAAFNARIVDASESEENSMSSDSYFGAPIEELLDQQFGVVSGRNFQVISVIQKMVDIIATEPFESDNFLVLKARLEKFGQKIPDFDPISDLVNELINYDSN